MAGKKSFRSPKEKYDYHKSREFSPARYGIKLNGTKHMYSSGFCDGFNGISNERPIRRDFGSKAANSYRLGHARGMKEIRKNIKNIHF